MSQTDRILFIDDDKPVRTAFKRSLRAHGFDIDLASGAEEAMSYVQENDYAVIATDYRMPKINGLELIERMRTIQTDPTYVLVSGECDLDLAVEAVNGHSVAFVICKPWDLEELASAIRRSLEAFWERSSQRQMQATMVNTTRSLQDQKQRLQAAMSEAEDHMAHALMQALDIRGHETKAHCQRVAAYSILVAEQMGLKGRVLSSIRQGAALHDVGKIGIPDDILLKDGPLSAEEWQIMRTHTDIGVRLLEGFEHLAGARAIVAQHHERWDGSGYPRGLQGNQITVGARIFAVADTLDAMLTDRPYRSAHVVDEAIAEIQRCSGTHFDPAVVTAFAEIPRDKLVEVAENFPEERAKRAA